MGVYCNCLNLLSFRGRFIILLVSLLVLTVDVSAQYTILYNDASSNALQTDDISVCQDEAFINTVRIVISSDDADNSFVTISFPPGVEYVPGSISNILNIGGLGIGESNIADLSNPEFRIRPLDLSLGNEITFQYSRVANCEATDFQMNGGTFKDEIEVCGDDGCVSDTDPNLNSYDLATPSISLVGEGPITSGLGTNVCRDVTLTNGGLGYLDSLKFYIVEGADINTTSLMTPAGTMLTPDAIIGDTLCYWLDATVFADFGNNDGFLDNGEQIVLERCYDILGCDTESFYGSYWGCPGRCMETTPLMQQTNLPNVTPNLTFSFENGVNKDYCFKGQSASNGGAAVMQRFEICNTGAGPATNFNFNLYNSTPGSGTGQNYFSLDPAMIYDAANVLLGTTTSQTSLGSRNYYQADCSLEIHPGAVAFETDITILPSTCIYIEIPTYANNMTQTCQSTCKSHIAWYYFNRSFEYEDQCGLNSYALARAHIAYGGRQLYSYDLEMPTDLGDCDEFNLEVNYAVFYANTKQNGVGQSQLKIDVSSSGLEYNGPATVVFRGFNVSVVQIGDIICVDYPTNITPGSGILNLPMKATCLDGGGSKSFNTWHEGNYDDSCPGEPYHLRCNSQSFVMHCPEPCPEGGATPKNFTFERISLGLADINNNGVPDGTGTADPADVRLHRASNCDTIKGFWEIYIHGNTVGPNAGDPFNHTYIEFDLNDRNLNCTYYTSDNLFEPIPDAIATIFPEDGSPSYQCMVSAVVTGDIAKYDLTPCKGTWEEGDSITFCALYQVTTGFTASGVSAYVSNNEVYSSYIPNPVGANPSAENKYTCDSYNDYMNVYQHYFSPWTPRPQTINGCTGTLAYYLRYYINVQSGDIWYPNEYRPFTIPDKFRIDISDALAYRPGTVKFAGQVVPDADVTQSGGFLTICNLKQFFQGYGGTILESDESWSYSMTFQVDPTCEAEPGIYYSRFSSEIIGNGCHSPSSNYVGVTSCGNTSGFSGAGDINYNGPQPFLAGGGTVQTTSDNACWDVILNNGSNNIDALFSWFYISDASNTASNFTLMDGGVNIAPDGNGFYQLGTNPFNGSNTYQVCANTADCDSTIINLVSGFGCTDYPDDINNVPCGDTVRLVALPLQSEVQLAVASEPALPLELCETQSFMLKMTSAQAAYLDEPLLSILAPTGLSLVNIEVEYPAGSGNVEPASLNQVGSVYIINVENHSMIGVDGIPGTIDALTPEEREVYITFDVTTDCEFISGSGMVFQAFGDRPCGDPAINNGVRARSSDLTVDGVNLPYANGISIELEGGDELIGCTPSMVSVDMDLLGLGGTTTSASDSVYITLDPGVEFVASSFNCCSVDPNTCLTFFSSTTDATGYTTVVLAFPSTPIDITNPITTCFDFQVQNSFDNACDEPKGINILTTAGIGSVPCLTAPGGECPSLQVATGQRELEFTTEKTKITFENSSAFNCNEDGELEYNFDITIDSMDVAAGDAIFIDIYCATALGTQGTYVKSEALVGPITAGTTLNVMGAVGSGVCNPEYGIIAKVNDPDVNGYQQCTCDDISFSSGQLICPADLSHTKEFISITPTGPDTYEAKWTLTVENTGLGEGIYNLNDIPGFDADVEICGASYTSDAPANNGNPGPYTLVVDGSFELAINQSIASGDLHTYMLFVCVEFDPSATTPLDDGLYTTCEEGAPGTAVAGEGLFNQSELDADADGMTDEEAETCSDLPCILKIVSATPGPCMPATGTFNLAVEISYASEPGCLINIGGQTFVVDGSGNEIFTIGGFTATGAVAVTVSAFFTCEATCFDQMNYNEPDECTALACEIDGENILCNAATTGSSIVTVTGGLLPYSYAWSNGGTTASVTGLSAGIHTVTVSDGEGTTTVCEIELTEPTALTCSVLKENDISCNGLSDGSATVTAGGGTGGYTYLWSTNETTLTAVNLIAGNNTVTITDANDCTVVCNVSIIDPPVVSCSIASFTNLDCNGDDTGSISILGAGGTPPLEYSIDGGTFQPGLIFTDVAAGPHIITVQDANGCTSTCSQSLTEPAVLSCIATEVSSASCGMTNGQATVLASGGSTDYTYLWDNGETTPAAVSLSAGSHDVTVTDNNGCRTSCSVLVMTTTGLMCQIDGIQDVTCNAAANGAATVTVSGGASPYTYAWSNTATTAAVTNFSGGNYTVTVTDDDGCTVVCNVEIEEPATLSCSMIKNNDITCNGDDDGSATVSVTGGTVNYTYAWSNGESSALATSLEPGLNTVTVTDNNNCTVSCSVNIVEPAVVSCSIAAFTNLDCNGDDTGSITVSGSGGVAPLEYSLDGGNFQPGTSFTAVAAGSHTIQIRDFNGCTSTCSQALTEPALLTCSAVEVSSASCGMANGVGTVTGGGGTPVLSYSWDNGEATATATSLSAGTHNVTITDSNNCTSVCSVLIESNSGLTCEINGIQDVTCNGDRDGAATVTASGGVMPYAYDWSSGSVSNAVTNFEGGNYTVTVTDSDGCTVVCSVEIEEPAELVCMITKNNDISCNGETDGAATVDVTGGTANYTYNWSTGETLPMAIALVNGVNFVTVTDANNCTVVCSVEIVEPAVVSCSISAFTNLDCNGDDTGSITVSGSGGIAPLSYSLDGGTFQPGINFTAVTAGMHTVVVSDFNGCTSSCTQLLTEPSALACTTSEVSSASCGMANGQGEVSITGGTSPYFYSWDSGETSSTATSLSAGTHSVTTTDNNGCILICTVLIESNSGLSCEISGIQDVTCADAEDGTATVMGSGGVMPYSYAWSNGATTNVVNNFSGGNYNVTVTDDDGCSVVCTVEIDEPVALVCSVTRNQDISCNGLTDGSATVSVSGGTPNYTYEWSNSESTAIATALTAGINTVTVTDGNGCTRTCSIDINEPASLSCMVSATTDPLCNGTATGTITVSGTGGSGILTFSIDGGAFQPGNVFNGVAAGAHVIVVKDANGCLSECSAILVDPVLLSCSATELMQAACNMNNGSAQLEVTGGTGPFSYAWDNLETTPTAITLYAGVHTVTVTDANNCTTSCMVEIQSITGLTCDIPSSSDVTCFDAQNGSANMTVTGGTTPYDISWSNGATTMSVNDFSGGSYTVTVTDADGCSVVCSVDISEPAELICSVEKNNDITCNGDDDGSASVTAMGGTINYTYLWSNGETTATALSLVPGLNTVVVTDNNGCTKECSVEINEPASLSCTASSTPSQCMGQNNGVVTINALGGSLPLTYSINGGTFQPGNTFNNLAPAVYSIVVRDNNACESSCAIEVGIDGCEFDLALIKQLSPGQTNPVNPGDPVSYTITVFNQGQIPADHILVTDYVPSGLTFNPANSVNVTNGWFINAPNIQTTLSVSNGDLPIGGLAAGSSTQITLVLDVAHNAPQGSNITNFAEISGATDENGDPQDDIDSDPNDDPNDDGVPDDDNPDGTGNSGCCCYTISMLVSDGIVPHITPPFTNDIYGIYNDGNLIPLNYNYDIGNSADMDALMADLDALGYTASYEYIDFGNESPNLEIDICKFEGEITQVDLQDAPVFSITGSGCCGNNEDEDDHDPEDIQINFFDLALTKVLESAQASTVAPGDDVTFTITVYNQGTIAADNIEVADYIPTCMTLNDADWGGTNPAFYTLSVANGDLPIGGLAPNTFAQVDITLQVLGTATQSCDLTNWAEISDDTDGDGDPIVDQDSNTDSDQTNDNYAIDNEMNNGSGDEDDHDPATVSLLMADLALSKDLATGQSSTVAVGQDVTFTITVENQGSIPANNISIVDYLDACMSLNDPDWGGTNPATYTMSIANGDLPTGGLLPMQQARIDVTVRIDCAPASGQLENVAEISSFTDEDGNPLEDDDSTPDNDPTNDPVGEDDIDNETLGILEFDLALSKELAPGQSSQVAPGDLINYRITVINQGQINADNIQITDYMPGCMSLADGDWGTSTAGAIYTMTVAAGDLPTGGLAPMQSAFVDITLQLDNPVPVSCDLTNWAEISDATDDSGTTQIDEDSDPDNDPSNDPTGEDDIDNVPVQLLTFDLALTKDLASGQSSSVAPGDLINYEITVINQGDITADNIQITDYIPSCMTLADGDWSPYGPNAVYTLSEANGDLPLGGLAPMGIAIVEISLQLNNPVSPSCDLTNWAEISDATDDDGMPVDDEDSDPDGNDTNDPPGEDDIDNVPVQLLGFDLALNKELADGQSNAVAPGDLITYDITVLNQGNISADNIEITDYIPSCMTLADGDWNPFGTNAVYTLSVANGDLPAGGLAPMGMASVEITLLLNNPVSSSCDLTNWAEISNATDDDGMPVDDEDSEPDGDDSNDPPGEDDIDNVPIQLLGFDLALNKELADGQASSVAPGDLITYDITVLNQGNIAADNIMITDYIPSCMTLADGDWSPSGANAIYTLSVANGDLPTGGLMPSGMASVEITLRLNNPVSPTCNTTNWAEISDATDDDGMPVDDEDSDPDGDDSNDPPGEDDIDDEPINVLEFDLALSKDLALGQSSQVAPSDLINYTISVVNQGDIVADNILVMDYIPSCMLLADTDWTPVGSDASYTLSVANGDLPAGGLQPMQVAMVDITLQLLNPVPSTCSLTNWAEIAAATDDDGDDQEDSDSDPDNDPINDPPGEDDIDDETVTLLEFDLALAKSLASGQSSNVMVGEDVNFTFTVFNQGQIPADNIVITDYIPSDFVLNDTDWSGTNPATYVVSVANGDLATGGLLPGQQVMVDITLRVLMTAAEGNTYVNVAEISDATDEEGNPQEDTDSDPDNDPDNDPPGEDDIDTEPVVIMGDCDLALIKSCGNFESYGDGTGGLMTYDITVINQGSCNAYNVFLIDYIDSDFNFADNVWFQHPFDGNGYLNIPGPIAPGTSETVSITLEVTSFDPNVSLYNWAEITGSRDFNNDVQEDSDSYPDYSVVNDGIPWDDVVDNSFFDEDDHDIENICITDLSIDKSLNPSMMPPYVFGDDIIFDICITNEGNTTLNEVTITDYVPAGFSFSQTNNPDWTNTAPDVQHTFSGPVSPGDVMCKSIILTFTSNGGSTEDYTNVTEITEVIDDMGNPEDDDWDSTPDNDDGDQSEDDEDAEVFEVYDLELEKTEVSNGPYRYGDDVSFEIEVCNKGSVVATEIEVEDRYGCGFAFTEGNGWASSGSNSSVKTFSGPLNPSDCFTLEITMQLQACDSPGAFENTAEIKSSLDGLGNPRDDIDSEEDNEDPTEDDQDNEVVEVFDLALTKIATSGSGPYLYGDHVEYSFTIYNQANTNASNIVITDYIPSGLQFNPSYVHGSGSTPNANADWTLNGTTGFVEQTIMTGASSLAAGTSVQLILYLEVVPAATVEDWINYAEISSATDDDGGSVLDSDSDPDNDPTNDGNVEDNAYNNENGDEDDHDIEEIIVAGDVGDLVWKDYNGDGIQDVGEPGVSGVSVSLYTCAGVLVETKITNGDGNYLFEQVVPGDYYVQFDISTLPLGCDFTLNDQGGDDGKDSDADSTGKTDCFTTTGEDVLTIDAGLLPLSGIGNFVWLDSNGNGVQDNGEPGLSGVVVQLFDSNGNSIMTTQTDANGYYLFSNLYPDHYYLLFETPEGYDPTFQNSGSSDITDSDVDETNGPGTTASTWLDAGELDLSWDAGFFTCVPIGDFIWYDNNGNHLADQIENGINGVKVDLYRQNSTGYVLYDFSYTGHKPNTPSDDGWFEFCAPPGTYYIKFNVSNSSLAPVNAFVGSDPEVDSNVNGSNGNLTTSSFSVIVGDERFDIDGGFKSSSNISGEGEPMVQTLLDRQISDLQSKQHKTRHDLNWEANGLSTDAYFIIERKYENESYEELGKLMSIFSDESISYDMQDYDIHRDGLYTYKLHLIDEESNWIYVDEIEIRVQKTELLAVKVYPNPATQFVNLEMESDQDGQIEGSLINANGQLIVDDFINNNVTKGLNTFTIDISELEIGFYTIRIKLNEKVIDKKLIIVNN